MSVFLNWPERIIGENVYIQRTTTDHLSKYLSWRKWEGKLALDEEEDSFANQRERTRKLNLIKNLNINKELALSVFKSDSNELISLLEIYLIKTELFVSRWIFKKLENIMELAYEAGEQLLNHIFLQELDIDGIFVDIPEYRQESISLLLNFGFIETGYYYRRDHKNDWLKMLTFKL